MFPSKIKWQVNSPGRAELAWASNPCTQFIKNEGGERFGIQKLPPPHSKDKEHEGLRFLAPLSHF